MQKKLAALGYREIFGTKNNFLIDKNQQAKGHEFHYSTFEGEEGLPMPMKQKAVLVKNKKDIYEAILWQCIRIFILLLNPQLVERWIEACLNHKKGAEVKHD